MSYKLKFLCKHCDLNKPDDVNRFVSGLAVSNCYKTNLVKAYTYYVEVDDLVWSKPRFMHLSFLTY